jgi:hypothetical protein
VRGEQSVPLTADEAAVGYGDGMPDRLADEDEPTFAEPTFAEVVAGLEPAVAEGEPPVEGSENELTLEVERLAAEQPGTARRNRRSGTKREPVAA